MKEGQEASITGNQTVVNRQGRETQSPCVMIVPDEG